MRGLSVNLERILVVEEVGIESLLRHDSIVLQTITQKSQVMFATRPPDAEPPLPPELCSCLRAPHDLKKLRSEAPIAELTARWPDRARVREAARPRQRKVPGYPGRSQTSAVVAQRGPVQHGAGTLRTPGSAVGVRLRRMDS